uniref:EF-hand domain-containing protein n=1 Tax=Palpitomonas bilix TaxID=652834 RepID=A0A7S3DA12_9EUKA|mmetsp:Transcript_27922/g.71050  ORF Transcript_27922/g.71050 Transcript_27922/m.71050 type:complete len:271 (+) Transcript_27922:222-1034(+)
MLRRALFSTTRVLPAAARTRSAESFAVQTARRFLTSNGPSSIRTTATIGSMYARAFAATSFVVGSAVAVTAFAEEEGKSSESESFRAKMIGNYENRIRALSSPEKVFYYFASVSKNGHTYMNVDDFLDAITPYDRVAQNVSLNSNPNKGVDPKLKKGDGAAAASSSAGKEISEIFKLADTDGDGLISFSEYLFFVTLLSIPEKQFRIAFQMFDLDGNGSVDLAEFRQVVTMMSARTVQGQAQRTKSLKDMQKKAEVSPIFWRERKGQTDS